MTFPCIKCKIHKYKVLKRQNMCYIFEKHGIQGYQLWHSRVSNVKYTKAQIHKYKVLKRPNICYTFSNFSNSPDSKVLKRPNVCYIFENHGSRISNMTFPRIKNKIHKYKVLKRPNICYIFQEHGIQGYQIWHSRVSKIKYTNTKCLKDRLMC